MSMCSNCGSNLLEGARFCMYCGKPVVQKKKKRHKWIICLLLTFVIIMAAGLALLMNGLFTRLGYEDYEKPVVKFMDGLVGQDMDMMTGAFPEVLRTEMKAEILNGMTEEEFWLGMFGRLIMFYGNDVKLSYTIGEAIPMDADDIEYLEWELYRDYDYDCTITEAYTVMVELRISAPGMEPESNEKGIVSFRIDGKWYAYGF